MAVPVIYRKKGDTAIASYDYIDVNEGTGIIEYCGFASCTGLSGSVEYDYFLTNNKSISSETVFTTYRVWGGTEPWHGITIDFDVVFNMPKIANGNAAVCVPMWAFAGSGTRNSNAKITILKVSGGVETAISSTYQSNSVSGQSAGTYGMTTTTVPLTRTLFKKGDILRLRLLGTASGGSGGGGALLHSPISQNSEASTAGVSSRLSLFMPFVLDL